VEQATTRAQPDPARWWTLIAVCVATFMLLLDITIVNVALPDIGKDLGSSFEDLQWVVDAYALTLAAFMLTAGTLADLLGRRRIFVYGLAIFTIASLLCGLANDPLLLNIARALQGVGGAAMFATSLALLATAFVGRERGMALGIWGATIGGSVAIGPLVGGALTEHIGWESIFFVNLPVGIAAIAVTLRTVRETRDPHASRVDWLGLVTFSGGLFLLVFALVRGNTEGWGSAQIVGFLAGSVVLLALFVVVELKQERPMLDLSLFRKPAFTGVSIAAFCLSASMFAMFLYLTLYLQNALGYQPLDAGLRFLPLTAVSFVAAAVSGNLTERIPTRFLLSGGLALVGIAMLLMRGLDADSEWTALLPGFIVAGFGVGLTNPAIASTAVGVVEPTRTGMAAGINNTFRQVGIATGIAGLGALFQHLLTSKFPGVPAGELAQGRGPAGAARDLFLAGYADALNDLFLVGAIVAFTGAVLALALVRPQDFVAHGPAAAEPVPAAPA
jgi:EmrB/QacA subfamily drug resistance transporter